MENCFTILCWFLHMYNKNQPLYIYIYIYLSIYISIYIYISPFLPFQPSPPPSHHSRSSQRARLGSLCYLATFSLALLYMTVSICQCYFFNSSHHHIPSQCPQVHSLPGLSVMFSSTRFHIYVLIYDTYFSLCDWLHSVKEALVSSTSLQLTQISSFYGWVIFHCINVPQLLYPFVYLWTFRLLPCPGYCKLCCNVHWGTCVF